MINATYTDILAEIRQFFAQHLLVNSFIDGQLYDFQAKDNVYSAVVLVPTNSTIQNTQLDLAFDLYFVDRINEDGSNTRDVYNDELQIAQDFISYFTNRPNTWNLAPENINIEPFEQRFADILGGWRLSVSVLLPFYKSVCDIPLDEDAPVPPVPPTPPTPPVYKRDHAQLRNLDYANAGHTGFQPTLTSDNAGNNITITEDSQGNVIINAQVPSAAVWGNITGDLEDQTDLYNLLQLLDQATSNNAQAITTINDKIPSQATSDNQLADKAFVNSSIATATATFMGTVTATGDTEQEAQTALSAITGMDENDYAFVVVEDTPNTGVDKYKRYKYSSGAWLYEYTLNNSSFTANQWNAINSGITSAKVTTYDDYATTKQDTLTAGTNITIVGSTISASGGGGAPIAYPTTASDVQPTAMTLKSSISDNGKILTECGFVYNTSGTPTINDNILLADLGVGVIEKVLQGLNGGTTYHIRSYGINSQGTTYGAELTQKTQSHSYITDGLVFHLSCEDFNNDANTIVEKINNLVFAATNVQGDANGMIFTAGSFLASSGTMTLPSRSVATIEVAYYADMSAMNGCMLFQPDGEAGEPFVYNHVTNPRSYMQYGRSGDAAYLLPTTGAENRTLSMSASAGYCNGVVITQQSSSAYTNAQFTNYIRIGSRADGSWQFVGKIFAIRIYSRQLTAEEALNNYLKDQELFY